MRVSLYKHELEVVERLTVALTRSACRDDDPRAEVLGPEIFGKLLDALYARGNYKNLHTYELDFNLQPDFHEIEPNAPV